MANIIKNTNMEKKVIEFNSTDIGFSFDEERKIILINAHDIERAIDLPLFRWFASEEYFNIRSEINVNPKFYGFENNSTWSVIDEDGYWMNHSLAILYANQVNPGLALWCINNVRLISYTPF